MQPGSRARAWLSVLVPVLVSCLLYTQSLTGDFTFDDRAAVKENRDVVQASAPWAQLLRDDFWGGRADLELSHKSYRRVRRERVGESSCGCAKSSVLTCVIRVDTPRNTPTGRSRLRCTSSSASSSSPRAASRRRGPTGW